MTTEFTFKEQQGAVRGIKQASGTMQSLYKEMEHYKKPNYLFLMEGEKKKRAIELSNIKSLKKTSRAYFPGGEKSFIASKQIKNSLLEENTSLSIWMGLRGARDHSSVVPARWEKCGPGLQLQQPAGV